MKLSRSVCAAGFVLTAGAIAWGLWSDAREAKWQDLLTSIDSAEEEIPYLGTRVVTGAESVKLRVLSRGGHRRIDFLGSEGPAKPAARPAPRRLPLAGGIPAVLRPGRDQWRRKVKDAALAARNYDVVVTGREVVAGRACDVIEMRARHPDRPSYRVSADAANRFPLRYEVFFRGQRVFETRYSDIQYDPPASAEAVEPRRLPSWLQVTQQAVPAERMSQAAGFAVLVPAGLPAGFEARGSELILVRAEVSQKIRETLSPFLPIPLPKLEAAVVHFTYTDGLAAIALVECSASSELWQSLRRFLPRGTAPMGSAGIVARRFSDPNGSAYLMEIGDTVVLAAGNVASEEIESMIGTLERRQ